MKINKSPLLLRITEEHLQSGLRLDDFCYLKPNIESLIATNIAETYQQELTRIK